MRATDTMDRIKITSHKKTPHMPHSVIHSNFISHVTLLISRNYFSGRHIDLINSNKIIILQIRLDIIIKNWFLGDPRTNFARLLQN